MSQGRRAAERVPLESLQAALALSHTRTGNARPRRLLDCSRSTPWSAAERSGHEGLRDAGVRGWVANHSVRVDRDTAYALDIAFRALLLDVEIDGWEHHQGRSAFEHDRRRGVALARSWGERADATAAGCAGDHVIRRPDWSGRGLLHTQPQLW